MNKYKNTLSREGVISRADFAKIQKRIKDNNKIIRNYFFKYFANYNFVLIQPDGEYLQIGGLLTSKKLKELLKNKDWSKYINDLRKSEISGKGIGFFNMEHKHNCI